MTKVRSLLLLMDVLKSIFSATFVSLQEKYFFFMSPHNVSLFLLSRISTAVLTLSCYFVNSHVYAYSIYTTGLGKLLMSHKFYLLFSLFLSHSKFFFSFSFLLLLIHSHILMCCLKAQFTSTLLHDSMT